MDILIGHLIGDYLLQNDWMGQNKTKRTLPCIIHCLIYTFAIWVCVFQEWRWEWWLVIVFFQHFVFDRNRGVTHALFLSYRFKWCSDRERMWLTFFYDNISHLITIWACVILWH